MSNAKPHETLLSSRFLLQERLGAGATATTYLAHDRALDRTVVIKTVNRGALRDSEAVARFEREARAAASVNHPNVVGVYDYGDSDGTNYLVLRHVEGISLRAHLAQRGRLSADEAGRVGGQVLAGLGAIHDAGLIHRDLKPENVIVGRDGLLRITDFGIAVAQSDIRLTTHGQVWGTPAYMAPEQVLGKPISPATDAYAVGVILFELLTGRLPFAQGGDSSAMAYAHVSKQPPRLRDAASDISAPPALEAVLRRALAKEPSARYQTAAAMAQDLENALTNSPLFPVVEAEPVMPVAAPSPASVNRPPAAPRRTASASPRRRRPRSLVLLVPLVLVGILIAAIGGGKALGFWQNGASTPSATIAAGVIGSATAARETGLALSDAPSSAMQSVVQPTGSAGTIAQATPIPTRSATPKPTAMEAPPTATDPPSTATKKPATRRATRTATPIPKPPTVVIQPTIAVASVPVSVSFSASDWRDGFIGDQSWYGRPWRAVYGALSAYPRASVGFNLDAAPSGDETLAIDGLDDEWSGAVAVEIDVNGVSIYSGPSPWQSWDGAGQGENANWTTASILIPAGTLHAGSNQIVVANTEPVANFGTGPYVLVSGAKIVPGAP